MYSLNPEFRISSEVVPNSLRFEDFAMSHLERVDPNEFGNIEYAFEFAKTAHQGQFRRSGGPFFEHPLMVATYYLMAGGKNPTVIKAALLHDVPEDSLRFLITSGEKLARESNPNLFENWEVEDDFYIDDFLTRQFGRNTLQIINPLIRPANNDYPKRNRQALERMYRRQIMEGPPEAGLLKGFDILHNNRTLPINDLERLVRKIAETRKGYLPIIQGAAQRFPLEGGVLLGQMIDDLDVLETRIKRPIRVSGQVSLIRTSA